MRILTTAVIISLSLCAAAQTRSRAFEVATVKPSVERERIPPQYEQLIRAMGDPLAIPMTDPSRVSIRRTSIRDLVALAFRVLASQVEGPAWMAETYFDVQAKVPDGTSREEIHEMLRGLLEERFGLALHHESKEVAGFVLIVGKGGPKFAPSGSVFRPGGGVGLDSLALARAGLARGQRSETEPGSLHSTLWRATMERLTGLLSRNLDGRVVLDQTGLSGTYDIELDFVPDQPSSAAAGVEKLGLKLESRRVPADILVIDKVSKTPTAN